MHCEKQGHGHRPRTGNPTLFRVRRSGRLSVHRRARRLDNSCRIGSRRQSAKWDSRAHQKYLPTKPGAFITGVRPFTRRDRPREAPRRASRSCSRELGRWLSHRERAKRRAGDRSLSRPRWDTGGAALSASSGCRPASSPTLEPVWRRRRAQARPRDEYISPAPHDTSSNSSGSPRLLEVTDDLPRLAHSFTAV
jgi:hypothetical protein